MTHHGGSGGVTRVLVIGPLGSGKSTVARMLGDRGASVIEADRVGHQVLEPGAEAFEDVATRWPGVVDEGRIDRSGLAAVVFSDRDELRRLESITHPAIVARIEHQIAGVEDGVVAVELPLLQDLFGGGWHRLVVVAPDAVRLERAVARGMSEDDARRRMAAQPPLTEWEAAADSLIVNAAGLADLRTQVDDWWSTYVGR